MKVWIVLVQEFSNCEGFARLECSSLAAFGSLDAAAKSILTNHPLIASSVEEIKDKTEDDDGLQYVNPKTGTALDVNIFEAEVEE